jgi:ankyrin repeat protein
VAGGAPVDARDSGGQTPLLKAATYGQENAVVTLLSMNADPNAADEMGNTPLAMARINHFQAIVDILHSHGASEIPAIAESGVGLR